MEFIEVRNVTDNSAGVKEEEIYIERDGRSLIGLLPVFLLILIVVLRMSWTLYRSFGQKTRNPQQRRMYVGSRPRQSLAPQEPTIYVSPSNLPPPPKYECLAPPSYEEVIGIHYPNYQIQPISQPINAALAQGSSTTQPENVNSTVTSGVIIVNETAPAPVSVTVTSEQRRTSVTVARP